MLYIYVYRFFLLWPRQSQCVTKLSIYHCAKRIGPVEYNVIILWAPRGGGGKGKPSLPMEKKGLKEKNVRTKF